MATQAHSLGDASQALDLASAGLDYDSLLHHAICLAISIAVRKLDD